MRRTLDAVADRLLRMVVPSVTAQADPCGREYYEYCYCSGGRYYSRFCCSKGGCGSCVNRGPCPV